MVPTRQQIEAIVRRALAEDLPSGDVTTSALFPTSVPARATIVARQPAVIAGLCIAHEVFAQIDPRLRITQPSADGRSIKAGETVLIAHGDGRSLLMAERIALNVLQRLSGIATLARAFCEAVRGYPTAIVDTRKTTPGLRVFEKWAVQLGGGKNHRHSLSDGVLIKDNHLALLGKTPMERALRRIRDDVPHGLRIIVEAASLSHVQAALAGHADVILLDNMSPAQVREAVAVIKGRALVEVSGGVTLANARDFAQAGADVLSIGALTHSAAAIDISMDLYPVARTRKRSGR